MRGAGQMCVQFTGGCSGFVHASRVRYAVSMHVSVKWLNDYLVEPASADEQAELLTNAGFPLEGRADVDGDVQLDFEMTSNRGDCVCHVGLAREVAAISGRTLREPQPRVEAKKNAPKASSIISVENREPALCPLYTARVIKGVTVKPSPTWLAERLKARGDIPRNNIVDATNFVLFELGQPTHVFDLAKLHGAKIIIRKAKDGEAFLPIGEGAKAIKLNAADLVIADADLPVALAGVKGGAASAVTKATKDILLEAATFHPVTVRDTSRRHNIASDSSFRFERGVHAGQIERAADRLVEMILEVAGGELCEGVVSAGEPIAAPIFVSMRTHRARQILGVPMSDEQMADALERLGFAPTLAGDEIRCTVPVHRLDITREVDLIEEVGRMFGHANIPIADKLSITVSPPQPRETARRAASDLLVGAGFIETVTYSMVGDEAAQEFMPPNMTALRLLDEGGRSERVLRPSILPSLLQVYAHNRDQGVREVKLFEHASTYARLTGEALKDGDGHLETVNLSLLHPAESKDGSLRTTRGLIERLVELIRGPGAKVEVEPTTSVPWFSPGAVVRLDGHVLGLYGLLSKDILSRCGIDEAMCAAEIGLPAWYDTYPPDTEASALPQFPGIERDLSAIVDDQLEWLTIDRMISELKLPQLESVQFVTAFRGKQIGAGRKSVTLRMRFGAADRTLRHEEVNPQVDRVVEQLKKQFNAEIRQ